MKICMTFTACSCSECQAMCQRRPCWPTPADARRLIEAGYADSLMLDWCFDRDQSKTVCLLTPAIQGRESGEAPAHPSGKCTFLDEQNLCRVHDLDLKPTEGQLALCHDRTPEGLHEQIGHAWDCDEGRALVDQWEANPPRGRRRVFLAGLAQRMPTATKTKTPKRSNRARQ